MRFEELILCNGRMKRWWCLNRMDFWTETYLLYHPQNLSPVVTSSVIRLPGSLCNACKIQHLASLRILLWNNPQVELVFNSGDCGLIFHLYMHTIWSNMEHNDIKCIIGLVALFQIVAPWRMTTCNSLVTMVRWLCPGEQTLLMVARFQTFQKTSNQHWMRKLRTKEEHSLCFYMTTHPSKWNCMLTEELQTLINAWTSKCMDKHIRPCTILISRYEICHALLLQDVHCVMHSVVHSVMYL